MIVRDIQKVIEKRLNDSKAIILIGPRQVGKTTLLQEITKKKKNVIYLNGDDIEVREMLTKTSATKLRKYLGESKILVLDEAQRIENIGLCLKIITDNLKDIKVLATGSSSFELANKINEPLTGRKWEFNLLPISFAEMATHTSLIEEKASIDHRLVYGYYPDVINHPGSEKEILSQLASNYLYKDILTWERIQKPDRLERLVQALAFQVGSLVSYHELGQIAGLNSETVEHYINLLEKSYVVFRLGSFSRNLRNELKKSRKIYFYDNGLRNALINQFNPLALRNDSGALWENFLMAERAKFHCNHLHKSNRFFWRNTAQNEIDYIEEYDGEIHAYEFKYAKSQTKYKFPRAFTEAYQPLSAAVINRENFEDFIL